MTKTLLGLVLTVAVAALITAQWIDYAAKLTVVNAVTRALGLRVTVDDVDIELFQGRCVLRGLEVANPPGFDSDTFLELGFASFQAPAKSLLDDPVRVEQLTLRGLHLNLERKSSGANYQLVLDNLSRFESSQAAGAQPARKKFVIGEVVIRNIVVRVDLVRDGGKLSRVEAYVPEIRLHNVSPESDQAVILAQLSNTIVKAVLTETVRHAHRIIPAVVAGEIDKSLDKLKPIKRWTVDLIGQIVDKTLGNIGRAATQAVENLKSKKKSTGNGDKGTQEDSDDP